MVGGGLEEGVGGGGGRQGADIHLPKHLPLPTYHNNNNKGKGGEDA